jgi:sugar phosphate permease
MAAGLAILAVLPSSTPVWVLALLLVEMSGPLVSPPITAVLLNRVPRRRAGTASGVYNTSRQIGGALAVAVFGAFRPEGSLSLRKVQHDAGARAS